MQASLEASIAQENWRAASNSANNLSELTLTLGDVPRATVLGEQSVELADRGGEAFQRMASRARWAAAVHQAGRRDESSATFREAEAMQAERQPKHPWLYSLQGFLFCDLLLDQSEPESGSGLDGLAELGSHPEEAERFRQACWGVLERAQETLKIAEEFFGRGLGLLDIALDNLTQGRAHLSLALAEDRSSGFAQAAEQLDRAVDGLRRAGAEEPIARGLLAHAALRRFRSDFDGAAADLTEALEIAERGSMRLHECDAHLEWARLCRDQGDLDGARRHVARARVLVNETGYGRRGREVAWLAGVVGDG